jgi:hypothetical protein
MQVLGQWLEPGVRVLTLGYKPPRHQPGAREEDTAIMDAKERSLAGALSGAGGTLVLSGLYKAWSRLGLVFETTPMQIVDRAEELGLVKVSSPPRRLLTGVAHLAYGVGTGMALGLLRRKRGRTTEEATVGSASSILARGRGVVQLAAADGRTRAALEGTVPESIAAGVRSRSVRRDVGPNLLDAHPQAQLERVAAPCEEVTLATVMD